MQPRQLRSSPPAGSPGAVSPDVVVVAVLATVVVVALLDPVDDAALSDEHDAVISDPRAIATPTIRWFHRLTCWAGLVVVGFRIGAS